MADVWLELEKRLTELNGRTMGPAPATLKALATLTEVRSGSGGHIEAVDFTGPETLLRVTGPSNRAYSGEWWFEELLLQRIDRAYSRIFFGAEKVTAIRRLLREGLALSQIWNAMTELWALDLPAGETLRGYRSQAAPQILFPGLPVSAGNKLLVGGATQIFFPVKNPLWVRRYGSLAV